MCSSVELKELLNLSALRTQISVNFSSMRSLRYPWTTRVETIFPSFRIPCSHSVHPEPLAPPTINHHCERYEKVPFILLVKTECLWIPHQLMRRRRTQQSLTSLHRASGMFAFSVTSTIANQLSQNHLYLQMASYLFARLER